MMDDENEKEEPYLICTICDHDLNNSVYLVCTHPFLHVPICILCSDELNEYVDNDNNNIIDICTWCFDGGDLFICGDGNSCNHTFCSSCIEKYLGSDTLNKIESNDDWKCLVCNDNQLKDYKEALEYSMKQSIYTDIIPSNYEDINHDDNNDDNNDDDDVDNYEELNYVIEQNKHRLLVILEEQKLAAEMIEDDFINNKRLQIRDEITNYNKSYDEVEEEVNDEINIFISNWVKHIDILSRQESDLVEFLLRYGYDIKSIAGLSYNNLITYDDTLLNNIIKERDERLLKENNNKRNAIHYIETIIEDNIDQEIYNSLEIKANNDDRLEIDKNEEENKVEKYPPSFENVIPRRVLQFLITKSPKSELFKKIVHDYKIPFYLSIVLSYSRHSFDTTTAKNWSFANIIHPSVLKVLVNTERPDEIEEIARHYQLEEYISTVSDIGNVEDVYNLKLEYKLESNNNSNSNEKLSISDIKFFEEDEMYSGIFSKNQKNQLNKSHQITEEHDEDEEDIGINNIIKKFNNKQKTNNLINLPKRAKKKLNKDNVKINIINNRKTPVIINEIISIKKSNRADNEIISNDISKQSKKQKVLHSVFIPTNDETSDIEEEIFSTFNSNNLKKKNIINKPLGNVIDLTLSDDDIFEDATTTNNNSNTSIANTSNNTIKSITNIKSEDIELQSSNEFNIFSSSPPAKLASIFANTANKYRNNSYNCNNKKIAVVLSPDTKRHIREGIKSEKIKSAYENRSDLNTLVINNNNRPKSDEILYMIPSLVRLLKEHQIEGVRFLFSNNMISLKAASRKQLRKGKVVDADGSGCILAHCMGLGKTFTVIAYTITLLTSPAVTCIVENTIGSNNNNNNKNEINNNVITDNDTAKKVELKRLIKRILIIAPVNTLENWQNEYNKWIPQDLDKVVTITVISSNTDVVGNLIINDRLIKMKRWYDDGGILIIGYELFSKMTLRNKSTDAFNLEENLYFEYLADPGPDLVIADEAHVIKNNLSQVSQAFMTIRTKRRVALTGSPLQNNLLEYWTMVEWTKPKFLGTKTHFNNTFSKIIKEGENKDATDSQIRSMKKRSYILHKKLLPIVNRKDLSILINELPAKREFVIFVKMTGFQIFMYKQFLSKISNNCKSILFKSFQTLLRLWNHPGCLVIKSHNDENKIKKKEAKIKITMKIVEKELALPLQVYMGGDGNKEAICNSQLAGSLFSKVCDNKGSNNVFEISDSIDSDSDSASDEDEKDDDSSFQINSKYSANNIDIDDVSNKSNIYNHINDSNGDISLDPNITSNDNNINLDLNIPIVPEEVDLKDFDNNWWKALSNNETITTNTPSSSLSSSSITGLLNRNLPSLSSDIFQGEMLNLGSKIMLFLSLLALSIDIGDKLLLFSQSLDTLNFIELCLQSSHWGSLIGATNTNNKLSRWRLNQQYFRLDGSTGDRQKLIDKFNKNTFTHLFLISTKAGNMGINLQSANRVIIFDTSWNPAHDLQAIFRSYRYGQVKNVFVYRFVASGSMEEKIYKKQVIKQTLSARIIDAQMPDNHFTADERNELLTFTDEDEYNFDDELESIQRKEPKDEVLIKLIENKRGLIQSIEDQGILLEDNIDEHLNDEERQQADVEYAREISNSSSTISTALTADASSQPEESQSNQNQDQNYNQQAYLHGQQNIQQNNYQQIEQQQQNFVIPTAPHKYTNTHLPSLDQNSSNKLKDNNITIFITGRINTLSLEVNLYDTVWDLKQLIQKKAKGFKLTSFRLYHNLEELNIQEKTLKYFNIHNYSLIQLKLV